MSRMTSSPPPHYPAGHVTNDEKGVNFLDQPPPRSSISLHTINKKVKSLKIEGCFFLGIYTFNAQARGAILFFSQRLL